MSTTIPADVFTALPDEQELASTQELPGRIHIVLVRQPVGF